MTTINFSTKNYTTTVNCTRGDTVFLTVTNIPAKGGLPYEWAWNIRSLTSPDPKTGTISQSDTGTLVTTTTTSLAVKFDLPGVNYALNTKHSFGLQLVDPDTNDIVEGSQIILAITADSVDDAGQLLINNIDPSNFVRSVVLVGLNVALTGVITDTDTVLTAFGKLQNQVTNKQNTLVSGTNIKTVNGNTLLGSGDLVIAGGGGTWGSITGTLSDQADLQNALNLKANKSGDTFTGKVIIENEVEIKSSGIVGNNNGIIQKIENDGSGQGVFRWLFNNTSSFPLVASFFRTVGGLFDKVTFNGNIEANNLSNTNTGDETDATIKTKLGITTLSGVNTGDQDLSSYATNSSVVFKTGDTMTGKLNLPSTSTGSLNLNTGAKPTTIVSGDVFSTSEGLFYQGSNLHQLDFDTSTTGALSKPVITDNGNGTVNVDSVECYLFSGAAWTGNYAKYVIPAVTNIAITNNSVNYLLISYNAGTPVYSISTSPASVNGSSVVLAAKLFREGLEIHWLSVDWGLSTANRLNDREVSTDRYAWQTGLTLGETTGRVIDITAGVLWYGCTYFSKLAVNSSSNQAYFYSHSAGAWTKSSVSVYNNTQYDNGTDLATLSSGRYAVNWVYRIVDGDGLPGIAFILGSGNYTLSQAQASSVPAVPPMISQMAILVGRIIVQKNAVTATQIDSAFSTTFHGTVTANHNDLGGLQGGTANEYYHLTSSQATVVGNILNGISNISAPQFGTTVQTFTPSGTTQTIDWNSGQHVLLNLASATGNVTLTLNNPTAGARYLIKVTQGATARNLVFPAGTLQIGGGGVNYVGIASTVDVISVSWNGTTYDISVSRNLA